MIKEILLSFFLVFPQIAWTSQGTLAEALPKDGEVEGWTQHRAQQHYAGESLYEYINGGAEIYHEYGFVQVVVQDYVSEAGKSVSVEIFEMISPTGAYGMYTFKTNARGQWLSLGNGAQLADYYMNFWKGPFLVTLTGFDESGQTKEGLRAIARSVDSKIPPGEKEPRIVSLLPVKDRLPQSLKYFTGFLGLRNSYPFFSLNISGYLEGIKGDYAGGYSFFIFRFDGEPESQKAFRSMKGQNDRRGRSLFTATHHQYMMMVLGDVDRVEAERIFEEARNIIED
jgi:hypothetical protein